MFQYGLVGNTIFYGGICLAFGYIVQLFISKIKGWELHNITTYAANLDEKQANEILGLINSEKSKSHKKKQMTEQEIKSMAAKLHLEGKDIDSFPQKFIVKDDYDAGKESDI